MEKSSHHSFSSYSYRKATMGSTFDARRAGMKHANVADVSNISATKLKANGSIVPTPYNMLCIARPM